MSKNVKIILGILFVIVLGVATLVVTSGGFGADTAKMYLASYIAGTPNQSLESASFEESSYLADQDYESLGGFIEAKFNELNRAGGRSTLSGVMKFANESLPVCVELVKSGEEWLIVSVTPTCK